MATLEVQDRTAAPRSGLLDRSRRLATETKHSTKSTELYVYVAAVIGVLIAFLTIGYMVARGLAKSGSREPYWEGGSNEERGDADR